MENCPYCNAEIEINHDDGYGFEQDEKHQQQCGECQKYFVFRTSIIYYYDLSKADCLNDSDHNFKPIATYPKELSRMRCTDCGEERKPTQQEMNDILSNNQ